TGSIGRGGTRSASCETNPSATQGTSRLIPRIPFTSAGAGSFTADFRPHTITDPANHAGAELQRRPGPLAYSPSSSSPTSAKLATMQYRTLGTTNLKVSVVGIGTWQLGGE